jgi:ribosomal protein S18 acetylase RimI-like enzyme
MSLWVGSPSQGKGTGKRLLADALMRSFELSQSVAATGIIVDAKDEGAAAFYERIGFTRFSKQPLQLFSPKGTIEKMDRTPRPRLAIPCDTTTHEISH